MRFAGSIALSLFMLIILDSCKKIEHLPPRPSIEFRSFETFDTTDILGNSAKGGRLKFYFEDGNGDLGLEPPGTYFGQSDSTNLFFSLLRKSGGVFVPADDDDPLDPSDYRIPYMVRLGQNKILKGTIKVTFFYLFWEPSDTIKYEFYIEDRANLVSNVVTTCEIIVNENRICNDK